MASLRTLPAVAKAGLVVGGYLAAFLLALCAVWVSDALADPADAAASAGMLAFGDAFLFLVVFALASVFPTGLALFFLYASPQQTRRN